MVAILIFLLLCATPANAADDVGLLWGFWGDSQTAGRAPAASLLSSTPEAIATVAPSTGFNTHADGVSGCSLAASVGRYSAYTDRSTLTWVHFQESGNQNLDGQRTPSEFASTFTAAIQAIHTDSPLALITVETAYSFGREVEQYRDWADHNQAMLSAASTLQANGINLVVADVASAITWLSAELGAAAVWYQAGYLNEYHYTEIGNLMVAMTVWDALGYDVRLLDYGSITDVSTETIAVMQDYFFTASVGGVLDGSGAAIVDGDGHALAY